MNNVLKRTTLIVRDAARSLAFYRDVLGMTVWYDDGIVLSGHGLAAGAPGDRTRPVIMQTDGVDGHLVRMTSLSFWDPDGYFFEVNQRLAA